MSAYRKIIGGAGVLLTASALLAAATAQEGVKETEVAAPQSRAIVISPRAPSDIPGGAKNADLASAAAFAWQEFIALNWPANPGVREVPDTTWPFGKNAAAGGPPLVWETLRHKIETFPSREMNTTSARTPEPQGLDFSKPSFGYDAPPAYFYVPDAVGTADGSIPACPGQTPVARPAWVNLDEITQIGLDQMFAGVLPSNVSGPNSAPQLIRFMAKGNRTQFVYVAKNEYWYHSPALATAEQNFKDAVADKTLPKPPIVDFPPGTFEVKSAWRPLAPGEDAKRFHTTTVRFYETNKGRPCYFEAQWGLIALHIIQRTPSAPDFVFATFEQADNILTPDGKPVEDVNGAILSPAPQGVTEPTLAYLDSPSSPVVFPLFGSAYCTTPGKRLFFHEIASNEALPAGGDICVKQRFHAIPPAIVGVNAAAHSAIIAYEAQNHVTDSPWRYYKLVNVQAFPFDKTQIDFSNPDSPRNPSTFFQANSVVETDYTLQNFSGRLSNGGATDFAPNGGPDFKNTHLIQQNPPALHAFNTGGCQGCHANAQLGGTDFSFILDGNGFQPAPDTPSPEATVAAAKKYKLRFER